MEMFVFGRKPADFTVTDLRVWRSRFIQQSQLYLIKRLTGDTPVMILLRGKFLRQDGGDTDEGGVLGGDHISRDL